MTRLVLVHGGYHGAWCWEKLVPEVEALGYSVLAVDMPGAGERMDEVASLVTWRAFFRAVVEDGDVLVGHSQGGYSISLAADEVPDRIARLIYLSAAVPIDGKTMADASPDTNTWPEIVGKPADAFMTMIDHPVQGPCMELTDFDAARKVFYHDCTPEDQAWAFERLKPVPIATAREPFNLPSFRTANIPKDYIVCTDDYSHPVSSDNVFMERLGLSSCHGLRSSHSPFLSMPAETAKVLDLCVREGPA